MDKALNEEIWLPIEEYPQHYEISNHGRVRSKAVFIPHDGNWDETLGGYIKRKKIHVSHQNRYGYLSIKLCAYGKCKHRLVHRLVAKAFLPTDNYNQQINHKDGNKTNNHVSNLEWCSAAENAKHAWKTGLMNADHLQGSRHYKALVKEEDVVEMRRRYGDDTATPKQLAAEYGLSISSVRDILKRRTWRKV